MRGFRKINGANWLDKPLIRRTLELDGTVSTKAMGKLPVHWLLVKDILLVNNKSA